jgi:hypothetical protein
VRVNRARPHCPLGERLYKRKQAARPVKDRVFRDSGSDRVYLTMSIWKDRHCGLPLAGALLRSWTSKQSYELQLLAQDDEFLVKGLICSQI